MKIFFVTRELVKEISKKELKEVPSLFDNYRVGITTIFDWFPDDKDIFFVYPLQLSFKDTLKLFTSHMNFAPVDPYYLLENRVCEEDLELYLD